MSVNLPAKAWLNAYSRALMFRGDHARPPRAAGAHGVLGLIKQKKKKDSERERKTEDLLGKKTKPMIKINTWLNCTPYT